MHDRHTAEAERRAGIHCSKQRKGSTIFPTKPKYSSVWYNSRKPPNCRYAAESIPTDHHHHHDRQHRQRRHRETRRPHAPTTIPHAIDAFHSGPHTYTYLVYAVHAITKTQRSHRSDCTDRPSVWRATNKTSRAGSTHTFSRQTPGPNVLSTHNARHHHSSPSNTDALWTL